MSTNSMELLLRPKSVVVIGASRTPHAIGNTAVKNFNDLDYKGQVYCVNPRYEEVEGHPCFPSARDIPGEIDLAIITVPVSVVLNAVKDCAEKKIRYLIIFSGGFAETGKEGLMLQNEVLKICKESGMRIIGPNTLGVYNIKDKISLTFSPYDTLKWISGKVGLVTQSGATGSTILNKVEEEKIGFSYMVTTGNQIDINTVDIVEEFIKDKDTEMIASYLEGVPDGIKLKELGMKALQKHKPFIVLKAGRTKEGQAAVMSHTASLTGSDTAFDLVSDQYGLTRVDDVEEVIDAIKAFNGKKYPKGNRVATVVISGATGIMLADNLVEKGQQLVSLTDETKDKLQEVIPPYLSVDNPIDVASTPMMQPEIYTHSIDTLIEADEVDTIVLHMPFGPKMGGMNLAKYIVEVSKKTDKPIITLTIGTDETMKDIRNYLNENHVPSYGSLPSAIRAVSYLTNYAKMYDNRNKTVAINVNENNESALITSSKQSITEPEVKRILNQANIKVPNGDVGENVEELQQIAAGLNYPLVAKIVSSEITHKSDVGGVILPINNEEELRKAHGEIIKNMEKHDIASKVEGILLEELVEEEFMEAFIGVKRDPVFGPIIMCGLGGIYVEIMKDISKRLAPVSNEDALGMIKDLKGYPLFNGYRKGAIYDVKALAQAISDISELALKLGGDWDELEINPLIVFKEGKGVMALDGLITLSQNSEVVPN